MSQDKTKMLCSPAKGRELANYVPGTTNTLQCWSCGQRVLVAPSSHKMIDKDPTIELVCWECFEPEPGDKLVTPEDVAQEARDMLKKGAH